MDALIRDLAFALRSLRKNPGFLITALLTLALGIGASTAIFSVVDAVLLRPLPYARSDRLVFLTSDLKNRNLNDFPLPPGDVKDIREQGTQFEQVAAVSTFRGALTGDDNQPEQVRAAVATPNLLKTLGIPVVAGRDFTDDDATPQPAPPAVGPGGPAPGAAPGPPPLPAIALISWDFWQRRFGGDRNVIGKSVTFGGGRAQIVGVMSPRFELLFPPRLNIERSPDIVTTLRLNFDNASRINVFLRLVGRLKPGATLAAARTQMNALALDLRRRFPIKETAGLAFRVEPMHDVLVADVRPAVLALMGAVTFVLLIACANVANLLLVRASRRERELAVRAALGGNRLRLVRQMLAEALVLALGGAALGVGLAEAGIRVLIAIGPASLPRVDDVRLDPLVLGFTIAAALVAAAAFGVVPALRASRPNLLSVLRAGGRNAELAGGKTLRNGVVTAEVALAFVLLIGSGLMFRSFVTLARTDPGFAPDGLLTFNVNNRLGFTPDARQASENTLREKLAAIPGVTGVTSVGPIPLSGGVANARWGTEAAVTDPSTFQQANEFIALPGYFSVMKSPLVEGRDFTEADNVPTGAVAIVDQLLAAKAFPGQDPVGKRLYIRFRSDDPEWITVIGVVRHEMHESLIDNREQIYFPDGMFGFGTGGNWLLRTNGDPARLVAQARAAVASVDPTALVAQVKPMTDYVAVARAPTRFALTLIGVFAGIAAVLSAVGLYGVLSTVVRQRTAELGVRMALGAPRERIFRMVIGQGLWLSAIGIAAGFAAALALTRVMRSMLVGVKPTDPLTFVAIAALFFGVAALACWLPARRAAGVDPAIALREGD